MLFQVKNVCNHEIFPGCHVSAALLEEVSSEKGKRRFSIMFSLKDVMNIFSLNKEDVQFLLGDGEKEVIVKSERGVELISYSGLINLMRVWRYQNPHKRRGEPLWEYTRLFLSGGRFPQWEDLTEALGQPVQMPSTAREEKMSARVLAAVAAYPLEKVYRNRIKKTKGRAAAGQNKGLYRNVGNLRRIK
jgi:hypothetical protein